MRCELCPHNCDIPDGKLGFCKARKNAGGRIIPENYGKLTSIAVDPIEKKPLARFHPGSGILSVGSYGCNMKCDFCQNYGISQNFAPYEYVSPEELLKKAREIPNNIGAAFTYNEPLISFEYVRDCALLLRQAGLKTVAVTNGVLNAEPFAEISELIDAFNIDVKAFTPGFYRKHGGFFETVKTNVEIAAKNSYAEVTTLIIPGQNDGEGEIAELCDWLAGISPEIPLHLSRYFPRYKSAEPPTPTPTIHRLAEIARKRLKYVYLGNV